MTNYGNSDRKIMQTARFSNIYSQRKHTFQQNLTMGKRTNKKGSQSQRNQSNQTTERFVHEPNVRHGKHSAKSV